MCTLVQINWVPIMFLFGEVETVVSDRHKYSNVTPRSLSFC